MFKALAIGVLMVSAAGSFAGAAPAKPAIVRVTINSLAFGPSTMAAKVGDTIEWTNEDVVVHTATASNHAFDVTLPSGKPVRLVLKTAGAFDYYCRYHPNMRGTLIVRAR
jgi:plastocyanin